MWIAVALDRGSPTMFPTESGFMRTTAIHSWAFRSTTCASLLSLGAVLQSLASMPPSQRP